MDTIETIRTFVAVASKHSFTAGAKRSAAYVRSQYHDVGSAKRNRTRLSGCV